MRKRFIVTDTTSIDRYKKDHELVSGIFHGDEPGEGIIITFKKYREDGIWYLYFHDGESITIERMVAERLKDRGMFSYIKKGINMKIMIDFSDNLDDLESLIQEANEEDKVLEKYIIERIQQAWAQDAYTCKKCSQ